MASNKLNVSDFDFDAVKANLKTFLQSQSEFQDYNFEGSGFAVLLDTLAYNTHYLGFNANMLANEMYLDSADIRKNIVSLAKMLGYVPTSVRTSTTNVDITINDATGSSVTMAKGTVFNTTVDGVSYQFVTNETSLTSPLDGIYKFSNVTLYEGTPVSFRYTADVNDPDQKFVIPSEFADTSTLVVKVQNSSSDSTTSTYILATSLSEIASTTKAYFLQEGDDGKFQVYFGDGIIGQELVDGNIVIIEYIVSNVDAANGANTFTPQSNVGGFTNISVTTNSSSQGGTPAQTKESVRINAPLSYSAQNRAVTTSDYETLVQQIYPNAQSVSAWGGEDDETPIYGVVKIAIKASSGSTLTVATKASIVAQLKKYNVASVRPEVVDPETTSILLTSTIKFDEKSTTKTSATLKSNVITALTNYNTNTLSRFDGVFRYSKVTGLIDDTDTSIISNITTLRIRKSFLPTLNSSTRYDIYFRNGLYNPHTGHKSASGGILETSGFKIDGDVTTVYYLDDDGAGSVRRYYLTGSVRNYADSSQGTIDYNTGQITINSLNVASVENIRGAASTVIELTVQPNSNDIIPVRDQVLEIDIENSTISVQADTFVGGSADAGVGYSSASSYNT
jgi:hypothetical protein